MENGYKDPPGIKVRAISGPDAVTYLDPGMLTSSLSYVCIFYPIILIGMANLKQPNRLWVHW